MTMVARIRMNFEPSLRMCDTAEGEKPINYRSLQELSSLPIK